MKSSVDAFIEGEHYLSLGLLTLAKEKFIESLAMNQKNDDQEGTGVCYFYLAQVAAAEKNKPEALDFLGKAREVYEQRGMEQMINQIEHLEKAIHKVKSKPQPILDVNPTPRKNPFELFRNGEVAEAIQIFEADVKKFRAAQDWHHLAMSLLYVGRCYFRIEKDETALKLLQEAQEVAAKVSHNELQQSINQALKSISVVLHQTEIVYKPLAELMASTDDAGQKISLALSKAEIYIIRGNVKQAEEAIHTARKCIPKKNPEKFQALIMIIESKLLLLKQQFEPAQKVLEMAQTIAEKLQDQELLDLLATIRKEQN
jgi:tetratricopeptide (TPR) repeat protein